MTRKNSTSAGQTKRTYLKQSDVPSATLEEALRIPAAIYDNYAGQPTSPLLVAKALSVDPLGSHLKLLSGAAIAFGLIEGGAQASAISMTDLSERILHPTEESMDLAAKREAILKPRVFNEFLTKYSGKSLPREDLGLNVLETMGVPRNKAGEVFAHIIESAQSVGFITEIRDKMYVNLEGQGSQHTQGNKDVETPRVPEINEPEDGGRPDATPLPEVASHNENQSRSETNDLRRRRVFITHGKNQAFVQPLKNILEFGELQPVVSVEKQSVSKPVPEKVMDDMRSCGAAIIHVDAESRIIDQDDNEHAVLNPNVLIEIGAAMAFYGRRFILLVRDGVKLPSNLQGLYEVRYSDEALGGDVTIKLLEAIRDIKNYELPTDSDK